VASSIQKVSVQVAIDKQAWEDSLEQLSGPQLRRQVARVRRELTAATRNVGFDRGGLSESQQRGAQQNLERLRASDLLTRNEERRLELAIQVGEAERRIAELRRSATGSDASGSALAEAETRLQTIQDAFVGGGTEIDLSAFDSAANSMQEIVESERQVAEIADRLAADMEKAIATERKEQARAAKERDDASKKQQRSVDTLAKQRERSLYKTFTDNERLAKQAEKNRIAEINRLEKNRAASVRRFSAIRKREAEKQAQREERLAASGGGGAGGANARGFQDASRRNQAALQQLIFAFEDAASSTDGLRGALRGAGNNISQFAQIFFQGSPLALGLATFGTLAAQLALTFANGSNAAKEAEKAENELADARRRSSEATRRAIEDLSGGLSENAGARREALRRAEAIRSGVAEERSQGGQSLEDLLGRIRADRAEWAIAQGDLGTEMGRRAIIEALDVVRRNTGSGTALTESALLRVREDEQQRRQLGFADAIESNFGLGERRAELQGLLGEDDFSANARAILDNNANRMDTILKRFEDGSITIEDFNKEVEKASAALDENEEIIRAHSVEQQQQADLRRRRDETLRAGFVDTAGGEFAEARQRAAISDFVRGGILAGVGGEDLLGLARERFGVEDGAGDSPLASRAAVGVSDLRNSGSELTRLLSGDDGSVGRQQLDEAKITNKLLQEVVDQQLDLAE
jgi:hypothetical protein